MATFALGLGLGFLLGQHPQLPLAAVLAAAQRLPGQFDGLLGLNRKPVLILGSDVVGGNTDVMFALQIQKGITTITQVPRDTYVETDDLGVVTANSLYAYGGMQRARSELSGLLGTPLDRHLRVNLAAVTKVADALGGVEIDVPKRMYYTDSHQDLTIDLYPGRQVLRGRDLEGYLRFRHDAMGDIGRMERQREVLNKVFSRLTQPSTLVQLPALLKIAGEDIETDLSPLEFTRLVTAMTRTNLSTSLLPMVRQTLRQHGLLARAHLFQHWYLDVLPLTASKAEAIRYVALRWNLPLTSVLVGASQQGDGELLGGLPLAVVPDDHDPAMETLRGQRRGYFAPRPQAWGLIDGLEHHRFLQRR
ncbi:MAG: LCP family protein [Cyanobium sp.]